MADRKYASDYRLEEIRTVDGVRSCRVYQGVFYQFRLPERRRRGVGRKLAAMSAGILLLLLPLLFNSTRIGRTAYVLLPMAFTLLPLYHLAAVGFRLSSYPQRLTRQQRDLTQGRLRLTVFWLAGMLGLTCAGTVLYLFLYGLESGEWLCVTGIFLAFLLSLTALPCRGQADTQAEA